MDDKSRGGRKGCAWSSGHPGVKVGQRDPTVVSTLGRLSVIKTEELTERVLGIPSWQPPSRKPGQLSHLAQRK